MAVAAWWGEHLGSSVISMADYSSSGQFKLVSIAAQSTYPGGAMGATVNAVAGAGGLKVLVNAPKAGDPAFLWDVGETKVVAGAAITAGALVMSDASGRVITYVNDGVNVPLGEARMAASNANDVITCFMFPNQANGGQLQTPQLTDGLTAHAGGGQASATVLNPGWNRLAVVATLNDSAQLPAAIAGRAVTVVNDGAAAAKIYSLNGGTDTIDGAAGSTGVPLTNAKRTEFFCITTGKWLSFGGGVSA